MEEREKTLEEKVSDLMECEDELVREVENRVIWIQGEITEDILDLASMIVHVNKEDEDIPPEERQPVKIIITTPGGNSMETNVLIDIMRNSLTPIITIAAGYCASNGSMILMNGNIRKALASSEIMFHSGSVSSGESSMASYNSYAKFMMKQQAKVFEDVLNHTSIPRSVLESNWNTDLWMDADTALKYGVIDEIVADISDLY